MTDRVEQLVRDAGNWPVGDVDTTAIARRAHQRQRRRWTNRAVAAAVVVAVVAGVGVIALHGGDDDRDVVGAARRAASFTWTPVSLPPGARVISSIAGGPEGVIAIGSTGGGAQPTDPPATPNIWYSRDAGASWTLVHSEPPVALDARSFAYQSKTMQSAYYAAGMFVVTGDVDMLADSTGAAAVWTSPDGVTWTQADQAPFFAPVPLRVRHNTRPSHSRLYDVTEWRDQVVAIGDVFTDTKRQPYGLSPAVWTSSDGTSWTRRVIDLGEGFDPYLDSVTARGDGKLVAGGRVDEWTAVQWTTRDLRRWTRTTVTDHGSAQLDRAGGGYFATGTQQTGPKQRRLTPKQSSGIPTIWWSADARRWKPVLTLSERSMRRNGNDTSFRRAGSTGGFAIVAGPSKTFAGVTANLLYASANGRDWTKLSVPNQSAARSSDVLGADEDGVYVLGTPGIGPRPGNEVLPQTLWRVTILDPEASIPPVDANAPPPSHSVRVTALPNLTFDAATYQALAGTVKVTFVDGGGSHALEIDDRALRRVEVHVSPTHPRKTVRVRLERGRYTIYCAIPGHRAAGMEATLIVR